MQTEESGREPYVAPDGPRRETDNTPQREGSQRQYCSFFWPIVLIAVGIVAMLRELGLIGPIDWWSLIQLWPILLILAGVDLLFSRSLPALGALLGLATIVALVILLVAGPGWGWLDDNASRPFLGIGSSAYSVRTEQYIEPVESAESARLSLDLMAYDTFIGPGSDADLLIDATIDTYRDMRFDVTGTRDKRIVLEPTGSYVRFNVSPSEGDRDYRWDVRLARDLPIRLEVDCSSGYTDMALDDLVIKELEVDGSSGDLEVSLGAEVEEIYFDASSGNAILRLGDESECAFDLNMSSGDVMLELGDDADLDLRLVDASSGALVIRVPRGTQMRVVVDDSGSGQVRLPRDVDRVKRGDDDGKGIWESDGYDSGGRGLRLTVDDMSSGDVIVEYR